MATKKREVGSEVSAWCTKCKLMLNHVVVSSYEGKTRVRCLTCDGEHAFRASVPGSKKTGSRKKAPPPPTGPPRDYTMETTFGENDALNHPLHGLGRVAAVRGNKIDVDFETGTRTLIHKPKPFR